MKKIRSIFLCCLLMIVSVVAFTACGPNTPNNPDSGTTLPADGNYLVVYFSATNNTKTVAGYVADAIDGATIYEIVPQVPYTSADLNYNNSSSRSQQEQRNQNARPEISGSINNIEDFDYIFIGYPIWNGQAPKIIYTFLESYDFSGKTIIPFCTSASSPMGSSATNLHDLTTNATWLNGQRFSSSASKSTVTSWVNELGI